MNRKITVVGLGYVGSSLAVLLSRKNDVTALDINEERVNLINDRKAPIQDSDMSEILSKETLRLKATTDELEAYKDAEFIIIAVPTNFDEELGYFDTSILTHVIETARIYNSDAIIVIKSTIPIGYCDSLNELGLGNKVLFSPEFLREGKSIVDNLYPSRIIVGYSFKNIDDQDAAEQFAKLLLEVSELSCNVLLMKREDAEAVKLFSNTYLAMRVAFFNELDSLAIKFGLNPSSVIKGVCLDPRIGEGYNNPSFGYGGYCLPKDTKQLRSNFIEAEVSHSLIDAIIKSNEDRLDELVDYIEAKVIKRSTIGFYRLAMKAGSDNARESSTIKLMTRLVELGYRVTIYDLKEDDPMIFAKFIGDSNYIVANRIDPMIKPYMDKVITRDLYNIN